MEFQRKIKKFGSSVCVIIPPDVVQFLNLVPETDIVLSDEVGKYGKYISIWRKDEQKRVDDLNDKKIP